MRHDPIKVATQTEIARWRVKQAQERAQEARVDSLRREVARLDATRPNLSVRSDGPFQSNHEIVLQLDFPEIHARTRVERDWADKKPAEAREYAVLQLINDMVDYCFKTWLGKDRYDYVGDYREAELKRRMSDHYRYGPQSPSLDWDSGQFSATVEIRRVKL